MYRGLLLGLHGLSGYYKADGRRSLAARCLMYGTCRPPESARWYMDCRADGWKEPPGLEIHEFPVAKSR